MNTLIQEISWLNRHRGALLILLGAPILYAFFYPLPYQHAVVDNIPLIVWDDQQSATSRDWIAQFDAHPKLRVIAVYPGEPDDIVWQQQTDAQAFLHIPNLADTRIAHQQQIVMAYGGKADNFLVYSTAMRAIAQTLQALNESYSEQAFLTLEGNGITAAQLADPIKLDITQLFNDNASYMQYLVPAVFLVIVQQVIMIALGMHWGYRFEMQRPLGHPVMVWLAHISIYLLSGLALIVFFYRIILPWQGVFIEGSGQQMLSVVTPFLLAVIGFGMVLSIGFREQESAIIWLLPLAVPFLLMAGASWPSFAMAPWVQTLAPWIPSTWGINALIDVAFMHHTPDYAVGWRNAFIWLSLGLLLRVLVVGKAQAAAPSIA
jgi:ABC-2 type transport system permease protein